MTMMIIIFMMITLYYDLVAGAIFLKGWREYSKETHGTIAEVRF